MEIINIKLSVGGVPILDGLNAELPDGRLSVLIGANGAGKTTLLRCLSGELAPDNGEIRIGGRNVDPRSASWRSRIGVVPDDDAIFPELTVSEQLALAATVYGIGGADGAVRARTVLELFDLWQKRDALGRELSAGMRKRLAICLALIHGPELLLMDEPLNALDYPSGAIFFRLMDFLKAAGRTVVVSGHHLSALLPAADRVVELERGRTRAAMDIADADRGLGAAAVRERLSALGNRSGIDTAGRGPIAVSGAAADSSAAMDSSATTDSGSAPPSSESGPVSVNLPWFGL